MQVTVTNIGDEQLTLKAPVSMGDFIVSLWSKTAIAPGESATAELYLLAPYDGGSFNFQHNLDPRNFTVSVSFTASDLIQVKDAGDTLVIPNGDNTPNTADGTDFGSTNVNVTVSKTYIIENIGILPANLSVSVPSGYSLTAAPASVISPGEQTSFTVRFNATATGDTGGNISIEMGLPDDYAFAITGHGNYYYEKVRSGLIQFLFESELVGSVANDDSPENNDGVYNNVTLNAIDSPIPGYRAPSFNGTTSYVNIISAGLIGDFNPLLGSLVIWGKAANVGVWTDGTLRYFVDFRAPGVNNIIRMIKPVNNQIRFDYVAGGVSVSRSQAGVSTTDWFLLGLTWDKAADQVKAYYNGAQVGATLTGLGVWAGTLGQALIGAASVTPTSVWSGYTSYHRLYNRVLSLAEITELNTIP